MVMPTGSERPLQYPLNRSVDQESDLPLDAINFIDLANWTTTDSDERVNIVLNLSLNEYIALATSIDVGRDIAYGDNSIYIWWIWVRALVSMNLCDDIANCIENSDAVKNALLANNQTNTGYNTPSDNLISMNTPLVDSPTCDLDELWGNAVALWTNINKTNIDALEIFGAETNKLALLGDIIGAIPVIGSLPVDEAIDFIDEVLTWSLENYNAALTVELETQITCDIFCMMKENCEFSFDDLFSYFQDYFSTDLSLYNLLNYMTWMTGITPTGEPIVYLLSMFQLYIAGIAEKYLYVNTVDFYATSAQLGEPDDDWMTLCTECPDTWSHSWLGGDGNPVSDGWTISFGTYNSGADVIDYGVNGTARPAQCEYLFDGIYNITHIRMEYSVKSPTSRNSGFGLYNTVPTAQQSDIVSRNPSTLTAYISEATFNQDTDVNWFIQCSANSALVSQACEAYITKIIVEGTGTDPFA